VIRSSSGKATEEIAEEIVRLRTLLPRLGVPIDRLAMDGDNVFVHFLGPNWEVMRSPASWDMLGDVTSQTAILEAMFQFGAVDSDPNHWLKSFRYDKLKPGEFHLLGPIGEGFSFNSQTFVYLGFSKASLLTDSASKMDDRIAARFVRTEHLRLIREHYDQVIEGIRGELHGEEAVPTLGSDLAIDFEALAALQRYRREYASVYWAMLPGVCLHLVTNCPLRPEDRLTVALYGLAAILLPYWERSGLTAGRPLEKRNNRRPGGLNLWAHSEEAVKKYVPTVFDIAVSLATTTQELRPSAFGSMGLEHYFGILRRLAYFDQRADVLADRAEMSLLKLWLRSKLRVPTRLDVGAHRLAESGVTFEPLPAHAVREPLLAVFARVKTAMHRARRGWSASPRSDNGRTMHRHSSS